MTTTTPRAVPAHVMRELRELLPAPRTRYRRRSRYPTQPELAAWLEVGTRTVQQWEAEGGTVAQGYALLGLAARFTRAEERNPAILPRAFLLLSQSEIPGAAVWGRPS